MKAKLDDDVDALFRLSPAEFVGARKTLAARLKKEGRADDASRVNALPKPAISVWTVNQLFWRHREEFNRLIAAGQRFRKAHASRSGKAEELSEALGARRDSLNQLSELATELLRDAGHNPSLDTIRRVATTLEAMSAYAALPDGQAAGRLTKDLDPPGFESLAPFIRAVPPQATPRTAVPAPRTKEPASIRAPGKSVSASTRPQQTSAAIKAARRAEEIRLAKLAAAKTALQNAKKLLVDARAKAQKLSAAQKKADAEVLSTDKEKRAAEQRYKAACTASTTASVRADSAAREAERANSAVEKATDAVARAAEELESLH